MSFPILAIARQYLRTTYSSRTVVIFALAMPLLFTFVLGSVIGGGGEASATVWRLGVTNQDDGLLAAALVEHLQASPDLDVLSLDQSAALAQTEADELVAALVIPPGFSQTLVDTGDAKLGLTVSATQLQASQAVEQQIRAATSELAAQADAARTAVEIARKIGVLQQAGTDETAYFADALAAVQTQWGDSPPLTVHSQPVTRLENPDNIPDGFAQSSPGMLVTFALVFMLNGAIVLILEREQGTLRRLLVMPIRKAGILGGKLLAIFAAGLAQALILIFAGQFLFGVNWGEAPLALVVLVMAFVFSVTSLGMFIAGVARTYAQANALANILMYSIAALGGAWWPIEITPEWMQRLAQITPTYWAMQGFHDIISRGLGLAAIIPEASVLLGFGVIYLAVGAWRFRYE
ncbi:MAG: ABC transporter permease [Caldilineales bacterium]|nr:ABC transporter permease [Caldilineales bacterium]